MLHSLVKYSHESISVKELDFSRGEGAHKDQWAEDTRKLLSVQLFNTNWSGTMQRAFFTFRNAIKRAYHSLMRTRRNN